MKQKKASGIILSIIICGLMFIFTMKAQIVIAEVVTLQGTKEPINVAIYVTKNELNQEIETIIQNQIPDKKIIDVKWEKTEKSENYVSFYVVTETENNLEVNLKYTDLSLEQNSLVTEYNQKRYKDLEKKMEEKQKKLDKEKEDEFYGTVLVYGCILFMILMLLRLIFF